MVPPAPFFFFQIEKVALEPRDRETDRMRENDIVVLLPLHSLRTDREEEDSAGITNPDPPRPVRERLETRFEAVSSSNVDEDQSDADSGSLCKPVGSP